MAKAVEEIKIATPNIGDIVWWYPKLGEKNAPAPAIVTAVETVGRVNLTIFKKNAFPEIRTNVYWVNFPDIARQSATIQRCGVWDYKSGRVPNNAYEFQKSEDERRAKARKHAEEQQAAAELAAENEAKEKPSKESLLV